MNRISKRFLSMILILGILVSMAIPDMVSADAAVNVSFNPLDSTARQDMEPATDGSIKDMALSTDYLEGTGAVKYGYKAEKTGGLYWYGRTPEAYASTGLDISGATHMTFDIYVSDVTGWTLTNNCLIGLRSLASSQGTGQWDSSCGQIDAATLYEAFTGLKNGWNRLVLPINTSVATETVIWGYRIQFPASSAKGGFYIIMDDVRFVNQAYLDSAACADVDAAKAVAISITQLPAAKQITVAHKTAVEAARAAYENLSTTQKRLVTNYATLQSAEAALANAGQKLDLLVDGLNSNALVTLPAGNTGTNYPKGAIVPTDYTEGDGSLFSNWPVPASGTLTGTQNGINISLVGVGGSAGLDISDANYIAFDMYVHGFKMTEGKTAYVGFGSEAKWQSSDLGTVDFTAQMKTVTEGWNHFVLPININASAVKNIRLALDNSCTAVTLTAEDAYVLLDDVRLLNEEGKTADAVRTQAKAVISAIAKACHSGSSADIKTARTAYNALSNAAKEYVYNLDALETAEAMVVYSFNTMDVKDNCDGNGTLGAATSYMQGVGAIQWAVNTSIAADGSGLFWYIRRADRSSLDITGAEYMIFDFYINDTTKWNLSSAKDARVNIRTSSSTGWDSSCAEVSAAKIKEAFGNLKNGWNHVVLPLATITNASDCWAFRMHFYYASASAGLVTAIDDVQFVSGAYLNSQKYADTLVAKDVTLQISKLSASSASTAVYAAQSAYLALNAEQKELVGNVAHLNTMIQNVSSTPVNISFRNLDNAERTAQEAATSTETTNVRVEGTGAAKFEHAVDRNGGLYWYAYCEAAVNSTGVNIAGATHVIFDFFVSDPALWDIGTGDMRFSVRNKAATGWDNSCTQVSAANMKATFSNVKQGWNHIVMPLESLLTNDAWAFRMYMAGGSAKQGFYTIIDDIRFVNNAYLASAEYADKLAAKDVSGMISQLSKDSTHAQLTAARTAYNALTQTQKGYVCNYDWLTTFEAGGTLPGTDPQSFQSVPSSHLGDLANFSKGEFSLAILNDLHYAVNYNSQQKDVYLNSMQYILERAHIENTLMTIQLGDLTSSNKLAQWLTVREGFQKLVDGKMPYATVIGNHDIGGGANAAYNAFLPYTEQVSENPYLAGAKEVGKTDNLYYTFEVNGVKYMVLTLTCYPKDDVLNWADGVVKAHPDHNVILVTHSYLQVRSGVLTYTEETEALAAGYKGITVWEKLVKTNPNIFMTFSAHNSYPISGQNGVGLLKATNDAGKTVYQFLVPDPQGYENTYGGLGSLFMLRFSNGGTTITGEYITTRYNKDFIGYGNNNFTLSFDPIVVQPDYAGMAKEVDDKIASLPSPIALTDESAVIAARAAYNGLPDQAKALVTNLDKLEAAEAEIARLKAEAELKAAAQVVIDQINGLNVKSLEDEAAVIAARTAYDQLGAAKQAYVTNLDKLVAAEAEIARLKAEAELKAAAQVVIDQINQLNVQSLEDEATVIAARTAYNDLDSAAKAYVTNLDKLQTAEAKIVELKIAQEEHDEADKAAAKAVIDKIDLLNVQSLDDGPAVVDARKAYDDLTDTQKALVTNLTKLQDAEATIARLNEAAQQEAADKAAAKAVEDQIAALNVQSLDDQPAVVAARTAYDALTAAQKVLVTNLQKLVDAEAAIARLNEDTQQEAADKAAAKAVEDQIAALDVQSLDDKPAVVAARAAYDALTAVQKALVTNLQKLVDAEAAIAELEKPVDPPVTVTYGDINTDDKVDATDALWALQVSVNKRTLDETAQKAADVNGDNKIDAADALLILKKSVNKIGKFPVEE